MKEYFPDYSEDYLPPWSFFWAIFKTIFPKKAEAMIDAAIKEKLGLDEEAGNMIWISEDFLKSIKEYHYKQRKYL